MLIVEIKPVKRVVTQGYTKNNKLKIIIAK